MKRVCSSLLFIILLSATMAFGGSSKVYTERDLEKYQEKREPPPAEKPAGKFKGTKMSIDVANADLAAVLKLLSDVARGDGRTIVIIEPITVKGVTISEKSKPWDEILSTIAKKYRLTVTTKDGTITLSQ